MLQAEEANTIRKNLKLKDSKPVKLLLISSQNFATTGFIDDLGSSILQVKNQKKYTKIEVALSEKMSMLVYAMQIDKQVMDTFKQIPEDLAGQVFIIELNGDSDFEYMNYIIRQISSINKAPAVLAVSNAGAAKDLTKLKSKINVPESVKIIPFDQNKGQKNIIKILMALKPAERKESK